MKKFRIGVIGATGKVGRTFLSLLSSHPWFEITLLCASERSAGLNLKDRLTLTPDEEPFANFILADQNAKSSDICRLIKHIKKTVKEKCGIILQEEILHRLPLF